MDLKALSKLIKLAQKSGLKRLKLGETEIEFNQNYEAPTPRTRKKSTIPFTDPKPAVEQNYTDMDILMWSVPGIDQEAN